MNEYELLNLPPAPPWYVVTALPYHINYEDKKLTITDFFANHRLGTTALEQTEKLWHS
jgi:hypothetical protein